MKRVVIESPYAGKTPAETQANVDYARLCVRDCILRGEAPIASHLLFTQPTILDDTKPGERGAGMKAGLAWTEVADAVVVYTDRGISAGMKAGMTRAERMKRPVELRKLADGIAHYQFEKPRAEPTPLQLAAKILAVGYDVPVDDLLQAVPDGAGAIAAEVWAESRLDYNQGRRDSDVTPPAWLAPLLVERAGKPEESPKRVLPSKGKAVEKKES